MKRLGLLSLALVTALAACGGNEHRVTNQPAQTFVPATPNGDVFGYGAAFDKELRKVGQISPIDFKKRYGANLKYLSRLSWDPTTASFYDKFEKAGFKLNPKELAKFKNNGFVVSGRMSGRSFAEIYYKIFVRDLPVFISADSLLHAWHRSYDTVLEQLEETYLSKSLDEILTGMANRVAAAHASYGSGALKDSVQDADYFIAVARSLLSGKTVNTKLGTRDVELAKTLGAVAGLKLQKFDLFGKTRTMDYSQFKVRGHYENSKLLKRYFKAMMWLGRIDMRVSGDGKEDYRRQLGSAIVMHDLLSKSGRFKQWGEFDRMIQTFVGRTDSMTFEQLGKMLKVAGVTDPAKVDQAALTALQGTIDAGKIGAQQIRSHHFASSPFGTDKASLPRSFTVMGQKFTLDSWATSKIVADDIFWDKKKVQRRMPSALDVAFGVLGNDNAVPMLFDRITNKNGVRFRDGLNYQHNLAAVRNVIDSQSAKSWDENIYTNWIATLRELSKATTGKKYPQAMQTKAWAMKDVNTQLASWAQLRHDTILYVKQSYTSMASCYYPAGYVDPRPAFWTRFAKMAKATASLLAATPYPSRVINGVDLKKLQAKHVAFFNNFAGKLDLLREIARKQFNQKDLTKAEEKMLKNVVQIAHGSGFTMYNGWYPTLFYKGRSDSGKYDALVSDVHTNVPSPILGDPGGVLHQGVGKVDFMMVAIDSGKDKMVYAGPTMSHYEFVMTGMKRKSDSEWKKDLKAGKTPPRPDWTKGYLVPKK